MEKQYLPTRKLPKIIKKKRIVIEIEESLLDQFREIRKRNHWTHADIYKAGINAGFDQDAHEKQSTVTKIKR